MKCLLVAINAKYIHSNLGVYSLKAYYEAQCRQGEQENGLSGMAFPEVEIGEYTINNQMENILEDIYCRQPDVVAFSCYIWNITYVMEIIHDLHKILPRIPIWLGGPEVSYDAAAVLRREPEVSGVMMGEGEETFAAIMKVYAVQGIAVTDWSQVAGVAYRDGMQICQNKLRPMLDMNSLPFSYQDVTDFQNRIIYYESSRGCPFSCSYCLSSIDKAVRFRSLELVMPELLFFLDNNVKQVKFVDRTFNCNKHHALAIWRFIEQHDNGVTNFHFEVSADLLDEEALEVIGRLRPGLIQLEIGVQTTNQQTIRAIRRKTNLQRLATVVARINMGANVHQHLDLIAGLPYEDLESFKQSFNDVYAMAPEQLQLGFLKVLKGSYMEQQTSGYEVLYRSQPPYEVLSTKWLDYHQVLQLKAVTEMVEIYYNSRQFVRTLAQLEREFEDPYTMFWKLAQYYQTHQLTGINHRRLARYEIICDWVAVHVPQRLGHYQDLLMEDLYLRENIKSRPSFAYNQQPFKEQIRQLVPELRQLGTQVHVEVFRDGAIKLFDYRQRDPLSHNAAVVTLL